MNQVPPEGAEMGEGGRMPTVMRNDDNTSANESGNMLVGLLPPAKRKEMGRPMTSREKASYKGLGNRTRSI